MFPRFGKPCLIILTAPLLLVCLVVPASLTAQTPVASPTGNTASPTVSAPQTSNERTVSTGNALALLAFQLIKPNLPAGTKLSSGFRTAQNQVEIIRQYANHEGIPVPPGMRPDDPNTWQSVLNRLRAEGYVIAAPGQSPHSDPDKIVLDLSRASLSAISSGCQQADRRGVVEISKTIKEHKNGAVHIELKITEKGLATFGIESQLAQNRENDLAFEQKAAGQLREKSRQEIDPEKRLELLRELQERIGPLDPLYGKLDDDISSSQQDLEKLKLQQRKQQALVAISEKREQGDWEGASQDAQKFADDFPDAPEARTLVQKIEAQSQYQKALDIIFPNEEAAWQCDRCDDALPFLENAISALTNAKLPKTTEEKLMEKLKATRSQCWREFILRVILWTLVSLVLIVGMFFAFRPGKLILYCEDGDQRGESFALDQPEIIIGSLSEPDGDAQIIINDRKRKISRSHCVIKQNGRRFYLKDLESANGTSVNGRRLEKGEYHMLKKGDEISLAGAATLIVRRQ